MAGKDRMRMNRKRVITIKLNEYSCLKKKSSMIFFKVLFSDFATYLYFSVVVSGVKE